jgi:hypothetical protein
LKGSYCAKSRKNTNKSIKAFKAFNDDLSCRGHAYEIGKSYEISGEVEICRNAYHSCENPLDVLTYYPLLGSRFAKVTASGDIAKDTDGKKIASAKITIDAELKLPEFISSCANWLVDKLATTGGGAHSATTGDEAIACTLGNRGQVKASRGNIVIAVEYDGSGKPAAAITGIAGQDGVPADTWLKAENGQLVEVD